MLCNTYCTKALYQNGGCRVGLHHYGEGQASRKES
jgi:hypothetical protein